MKKRATRRSVERLGLSPSGGDRKHRKRPQREQRRKKLSQRSKLYACEEKEKKNDNRWEIKKEEFGGSGKLGRGVEKGLWDGRG